MKQKIIIHASEPLNIIETIDQHAPVDRHFSYSIEGDMRSPSDSYHTFDELYDHRITLYIALCRALGLANHSNDQYIWRSKKHSDGELCFGTGTRFILGMNVESGKQISYHIPIERWEETDFAHDLEKAPEWDGHTSNDVLERIKRL